MHNAVGCVVDRLFVELGGMRDTDVSKTMSCMYGNTLKPTNQHMKADETACAEDYTAKWTPSISTRADMVTYAAD